MECVSQRKTVTIMSVVSAICVIAYFTGLIYPAWPLCVGRTFQPATFVFANNTSVSRQSWTAALCILAVTLLTIGTILSVAIAYKVKSRDVFIWTGVALIRGGICAILANCIELYDTFTVCKASLSVGGYISALIGLFGGTVAVCSGVYYFRTGRLMLQYILIAQSDGESRPPDKLLGGH